MKDSLPFDITRASLEDAQLIAPLFDAYRVFYEQESNPALALEFITARLKNDESMIYLARSQQGRAAGFIQVYPSFSSVSAVKTWILNDLFVDGDFRGTGLGRLLMNHVAAELKTLGGNGIALETHSDNHIAQNLYESIGYETDEHTLHYFLSF